jgi:hypothetical protein
MMSFSSGDITEESPQKRGKKKSKEVESLYGIKSRSQKGHQGGT